MVGEGIGRISKRKDGKYFLYLPKHLVEDTGFPFEVESSIPVKVVMDRQGSKLIVTALTQKQEPRRKRS